MSKKSKKGALAPQLFKGLNDKRMKSGGGDFLPTVRIKQGSAADVQFLEGITEFVEYDQHQFRDNNSWSYVPCGGDSCPLCQDEDGDVSKTHYRFAANVYDFDNKEVRILEGPKTLSQLIAARYKKNPKEFNKRAWEVTKFTESPWYDVDRSEKAPADLKKLEPLDLTKFVTDQFKFYFGDAVSIDALEATDDEEVTDSLSDEVWTKKSLKELDDKELKKAAKTFGIKIKDKTKKEVVKMILDAQIEPF